MKNLLLLVLAVLMLTGCGKDDQKPVDDAEQPETAPAYYSDQEVYGKAADSLVGRFVRSLQSELLSAINEGGPVNAIEVCNVRATQISDAVSIGGWSIGRVSDRFRNPANGADSSELIILAAFADSGANVPGFIDRWSGPDTAKMYHFYKPIRTRQLCLRCHGGLQTLAPGVYQALRRYYPADHAVGYRAGDLRGMFVVEAAWPEGKEFAELLASGQPIPEPVVPDTLSAEPDSSPEPDSSHSP
jgi:hypothetical protein